jgi:hypothetical protein
VKRKPRCMYCEDKPARLLMGEAQPVFCSFRCAAHKGIETTMDLNWCHDCREWFDREGMKDHKGHSSTYDE